MSAVVFSGERIWREAQNVVAALTLDMLADQEPDAFVLRNNLADQMYVTAAHYALLKQLVRDIRSLTGLSVDDCLKSLGLKVAAIVSQHETG